MSVKIYDYPKLLCKTVYIKHIKSIGNLKDCHIVLHRNISLVLQIIWWTFQKRFWIQTALIQSWRTHWSKPFTPYQRDTRAGCRASKNNCKGQTGMSEDVWRFKLCFFSLICIIQRFYALLDEIYRWFLPLTWNRWLK